jgi:hypothetical protein
MRQGIYLNLSCPQLMRGEERNVPGGAEGGDQRAMLGQGHHQVVSYLLLCTTAVINQFLEGLREETREPCSGRDTTR